MAEVGRDRRRVVGYARLTRPHRVRDLAAFVEETATNRETLEKQLDFAIKTAPKLTIQGGTTEVLRGIIARGLGLR